MDNKKKTFPIKRKLTWMGCIVGTVFGILLLSQLIGVSCIAISLKLGLITLGTTNPIRVALEYLFLISLIFGTVLTVIACRISLRPARRFIETTRQIAAGDFSVRFQLGGLEESTQLMQSLNTMVEELGSIETLRDDFVSNISHEFKTPVASIYGFAKLLKKGNLTQEQQNEYLDIIISEAERLSTLSKNVLLLSRLDNTVRMTDVEKYSLDEQLRRTILILNQEIKSKEIDVDVSLQPYQINANEEMLSQVWINLLNNAVKFTPQGGRIGICLQNAGESAIVSIQDNGIGMEPEVIKHIFDKFYQGDSSRSCEGNGLGLALAKRIVQLSGGSIQVESQPGIGSQFTVLLPNKIQQENGL
ncbi:MAG: sensor histidine kinase [Faecousia sp.]